MMATVFGKQKTLFEGHASVHMHDLGMLSHFLLYLSLELETFF